MKFARYDRHGSISAGRSILLEATTSLYLFRDLVVISVKSNIIFF